MTVVSETKAPGSSTSGQVREIAVAHSPDSDDAFMFYGLATNKVRTPGLRFTHTLCDIETLNQKAREGVYDVSAISFHAYRSEEHTSELQSLGSARPSDLQGSHPGIALHAYPLRYRDAEPEGARRRV